MFEEHLSKYISFASVFSIPILLLTFCYNSFSSSKCYVYHVCFINITNYKSKSTKTGFVFFNHRVMLCFFVFFSIHTCCTNEFFLCLNCTFNSNKMKKNQPQEKCVITINVYVYPLFCMPLRMVFCLVTRAYNHSNNFLKRKMAKI